MTISMPPLSFSLTELDAANFLPKHLAASFSLTPSVSRPSTTVTDFFFDRTSTAMVTRCLSSATAFLRRMPPPRLPLFFAPPGASSSPAGSRCGQLALIHSMDFS